MQKDKYAKIELRPNKATSINIIPEWIHPKYELKYEPSSNATDTGHLELFRLKPVEPELPTFSARWDLRPNTVDIDLIGTAEAGKAFKAGVGGYAGHHTAIAQDSPRTYQIHIQTPLGAIFSGKIELIIELGVYLKDSFEEFRDQVKDELRILIDCPQCGPVQVPGPKFQFDHCPNCRRDLRVAPN